MSRWPLLVSVSVAVGLGSAWVGPTNATTYTVITTSDTGVGSLRQAILDANAHAGPDSIHFNIPGTGLHTIRPGSPLAPIIDQVVIDAYTQPGASPATASTPATLKIELDGSLAGTIYGLDIAAGGSTVRGLVVNRFGASGIRLRASGGNAIQGNHVGTDANGTADRGNSDYGVLISGQPGNTIGGTTAAARNVISGNGIAGVLITDAGATGNVVQGNYIGTDANGTGALPNELAGVRVWNAPGNTLGGLTAQARNVISGNFGHGVSITGGAASANVVQGNYIGTDATGTIDLGNAWTGVSINAPDNTVGGSSVGARNTISGNDWDGIDLYAGATGNLVQGNYVGTDGTGTAALGNSLRGVYVYSNACGNTIGGWGSYADNVVAYNAGDGVCVASGTGNAILSNSIFDNGGLGIDLGGDGVTPNDPGDGDTGANNLQNFPVLTSAVLSGGDMIVSGTLDAGAPSAFFTICLFCNSAADPSGYGEGEACCWVAQVETSPSGGAAFTMTFPIPGAVCRFVTATATDPANNTSEFSESVVVSMVLTGNLDHTPGQLWLDWPDVPWANSYRLYGAGNEAYFPIDDQHELLVLPGIYSSWSTPNGIGDPGNNWTYLVVAFDLWNQELCRSNRYGEHDFDVSPP